MTYESIQPAQTAIEAEVERITRSAYLFGLDEDGSNPILSLDSSARIVFLLHHLLAYKVEKAALLAEMSEIEFRTHLRSAYLQLASFQLGYDVYFASAEEPALA